jgi:hypothetical protein
MWTHVGSGKRAWKSAMTRLLLRHLPRQSHVRHRAAGLALFRRGIIEQG